LSQEKPLFAGRGHGPYHVKGKKYFGVRVFQEGGTKSPAIETRGTWVLAIAMEKGAGVIKREKKTAVSGDTVSHDLGSKTRGRRGDAEKFY